MKKLIFLYCTLLLVSCQDKPKQKEKETAKKVSFEQFKSLGNYTISGEDWNEFDTELVKLQVSDTVPEGFRTLAVDTIKNGAFKLKGTIQFPQNSYISIYGLDNEYIYSTDIVVEPGDIHLKWDSSYDRPTIEGGIYNQKIIQEVYSAKELMEAFPAYQAAESKSYFEQDTVKLNTYRKVIADYSKKVSAKFGNIRFNSEDPLARLLTMTKSNFFLDFKPDYLNIVSKEVDSLETAIGLGEIPESTLIKDAIQTQLNSQNANDKITLGKQIKDFTAKDLNGKEFNLKEQLQKNSFVLVEFWASWCGPCREEIPHMKEVYTTYNSKGFDIVSFSIDSKEEKWKKASEEEKIPWVNVSDLKAMRSPVAKLYGITAIPANYLVDATGTIVATNLRGEELEEKVKELLKI